MVFKHCVMHWNYRNSLWNLWDYSSFVATTVLSVSVNRIIQSSSEHGFDSAKSDEVKVLDKRSRVEEGSLIRVIEMQTQLPFLGLTKSCPRPVC